MGASAGTRASCGAGDAPSPCGFPPGGPLEVLRFNGWTGSSGCWLRSLGCQFPSQFGDSQSGKVPTLRSQRSCGAPRCYPALARVTLCAQRPWVLPWIGSEGAQGAPGAAGDRGVFLAAAATATATAVVTMTQLPAFLPSRAHRVPHPALGGGQGRGGPRTSTPTVPELPSDI